MKAKLYEIAGWYGALAILGAYLLVSLNYISSQSMMYQLLNATGAVGIIIITLYKKVYQSVVLNSIWLLIALVAIVKMFIHS